MQQDTRSSIKLGSVPCFSVTFLAVCWGQKNPLVSLAGKREKHFGVQVLEGTAPTLRLWLCVRNAVVRRSRRALPLRLLGRRFVWRLYKVELELGLRLSRRLRETRGQTSAICDPNRA